jgi:class 3 adenylate cyclase
MASNTQLAEALAGVTVVVAEDLEPLLRATVRMLERSGARVFAAADGEAAVELVRLHRPDIALFDVDMPGMTGIEACRILRATDSVPRIPIVLLTGRGEEERQIDGLAAGCDDFLVKPVSQIVLALRLASLVSKLRVERANAQLVATLSRYVTKPARDGRTTATVESIDGTILFSDLRGFTAISTEVDAATLFEVVSRVQTAQTRCVVDFGGYVDKFSGDGMLAVFSGEQHASRACSAAQAICAWAGQHLGGAFWSPPPIGIGIDTGTFVRGNMGGHEHLEFTVIGRTVNTASRLCGLAGALDVVASAATAESAAFAHVFRESGSVAIKGLPVPIPVWRLDPAPPP